jgi:hypothetical protein
MKRWLFFITAVMSLMGIAGCDHLQEYVAITREKGMSEEYLGVLNRWTRSQIVYAEFETRVHIGATYRSPEFNRTYFKEYARIYQLSEGERKKRDEVLSAANSDVTEFIFYAYIPEKSSNDFDRRGSIWKIFLVTGDGARFDPVEVRRIDPVTPVTTDFFPYINPYYGIPYLVRFSPLGTAGTIHDTMTLNFASVIGNVALEFKTRGDAITPLATTPRVR